MRALTQAGSFADAVDAAVTDADFSLVDGLDAPLLAALVERRRAGGHPATILAITPTGRRAESLGIALEALIPDAVVRHFPAWETLPHERLSPSAETVGRRLEVLQDVARWDGVAPLIVTASVRSALQPIAAGLAEAGTIDLVVGERGRELSDTIRSLVELAYHRVDMVSRRGEFAVRGGILDVFPPVADHPFRVEFFGDEIDQIRAFSVADQRSLPGEWRDVRLLAARELLLTDRVRARALSLRDQFPSLKTMLEKMAEGIPVEGMESLLPVVADGVVPLVDYLPDSTAVALVDPERSIARASTLAQTNQEFLDAAWNAATAGAQAPVDLGSGDFLTLPELREAVHDRNGVWWELSGFDSGAADAEAEGLVVSDDTVTRVEGTAVPSFQGNMDGATAHVGALLADGWRVVVTASGVGLVDRAVDVLAERGIAARAVDDLTDVPETGSRWRSLPLSNEGSKCPRRRSPS